jgi:hypothetical protein
MKSLKLICFLLPLLVTSMAFAQKNLVTDGGFEDELYGWNNNGGSTTPWDFKSGKTSCAIISPQLTNWSAIDQTIRIPKKVQTLEFSAWLKTQHVAKGKNSWGGAIFTIEFTDAGDKKVGEDINIATLVGDQPWALATKILKVPANAVNFKIMLALNDASGNLLVDDVSAKALADDVPKQ